MEAKIAMDKVALISSSPAVALAPRAHFGDLAGPHLSATTNLGVGAAAGLARRQAARSQKSKVRMPIFKRK
eukprot:8283620-Pyramimonas_sp.AAC.1